MAPDTWFSRDLPVLDAIVTYLDEHAGRSFPQLSDIAEITGMEVEDVSRAGQALDGVYIELGRTMGPAAHWHVSRVSPNARTATGQWPSADSLAARIIDGLERAAADEPDEIKRGKFREAAAVLGGTAKDVGTNVLTAVILRSTGMG